MVRPYPSITNWSTVGISVYKNGEAAKLVNVVTNPEKRRLALRTILYGLLGAAVGLCISGAFEVLSHLVTVLFYH